MKDKEYVKAFKLLTQRLRDSTNDPKARLVITFVYDLRPQVIYFCNGNFLYFLNSYGDVVCGNETIDSRIKSSSYAHFYSVGHLMKGFLKTDFIKMWIDNAIGADLYVNDEDVYCETSKFLDKNDTVESLCVQYDMTHI